MPLATFATLLAMHGHLYLDVKLEDSISAGPLGLCCKPTPVNRVLHLTQQIGIQSFTSVKHGLRLAGFK